MFDSTYVCEQLFSLMKLNSHKNYNQITNVKLSPCPQHPRGEFKKKKAQSDHLYRKNYHLNQKP